MIKSSSVLRLLLLLVTLPAISQQTSSGAPNEVVRVDLSAPSTPFPHFWEEMFGSGRANLTLRDSYRRDLDWVRGITEPTGAKTPSMRYGIWPACMG